MERDILCKTFSLTYLKATTKLGHGSELVKKQMESAVGLLFFGV